jgi:hypothetical protein
VESTCVAVIPDDLARGTPRTARLAFPRRSDFRARRTAGTGDLPAHLREAPRRDARLDRPSPYAQGFSRPTRKFCACGGPLLRARRVSGRGPCHGSIDSQGAANGGMSLSLPRRACARRSRFALQSQLRRSNRPSRLIRLRFGPQA